MTEERKPLANIPPFGLRLQPDLKQRVEEAARANSRSLNSEIVARLELSFQPRATPDEAENRRMQEQVIKALANENLALGKVIASYENIMMSIAGAIHKASQGDSSELEALLAREQSNSIYLKLKTMIADAKED
jgi:hypothetical protein